MTELSISELLKEKQERDEYAIRVIAAISINYEFVDRYEYDSLQCAGAGRIYKYLSAVLGESNSWQFKRKIKTLLVEKELIKPTWRHGLLWFKGIGGIDADKLKANKIIAEHILENKRYERKQRAYTMRRKSFAASKESA